MGGVKALAALRRCDPEILAIAITGGADDTATLDLRAQGFTHVLAKPFLVHELLGTIRAIWPVT